MDKINNLATQINIEERRDEKNTPNGLEFWEKHLNNAQLYALGRLRGFGYDLKFVRYNSENLAIFSTDKDFTDIVAVDNEGDISVNPHIVIRK